METIINLHIEQLPEGYYLATSSDVQGLVAQGRTIAETLEIARDVARRLIEAQTERNSKKILRPIENTFDLQVVVGC
jgi:predicted RNase H-like HicB family nuclease